MFVFSSNLTHVMFVIIHNQLFYWLKIGSCIHHWGHAVILIIGRHPVTNCHNTTREETDSKKCVGGGEEEGLMAGWEWM